MNRGGGGFFSRMITVAILLCVVFGGFYYVSNHGGMKAVEGFLDGKSNSASEKLDSLDRKIDKNIGINSMSKLNDNFGEPGKDKQRPYKEYNAKALKNLQGNVADPQEKPGYSRDKFFVHSKTWNKIDEDESQKAGWSHFKDKKCSVRNAVLAEQGTKVTYKKGCSSIKGTWVDKYGAKKNGKITYKKSTNPRDFDIDHVIALSLAWRSGMGSVSGDTLRNMLANDRANLVVSDKSLNRSKGDQSFDEWTPPLDSANYCDYYDRYVYIKAKYNLTVTSEELSSLEKASEKCHA